jgi:hypothetical protein
LASDKADYQLYVQSGDIFPSMFMNDDGEEAVEDEKRISVEFGFQRVAQATVLGAC